jgi:hypothetical protein
LPWGGLPGRLVIVGVGGLQFSLAVVRACRLGSLPRPARVLPGSAGPGLGFGRPGLRGADGLVPLLPRLVPLLPRPGHLLLSGPFGLGGPSLRGLPFGRGLLLGGSLRRQRLGQPRLGLQRRSTRLPGLGLGPLGAGLEPGPGLLCRGDLRLERGLVPRGVLAGPVRSSLTASIPTW